MSTTNINPYAQRIANVLGQTLKTTQASLPTVSFLPSAEGSVVGSATKYIIYALIAALVILLILVLIHYTVTPIFNFGDNPDALISIPSNEWRKDWNNKDIIYNDARSQDTLQQTKYSIVFDTQVDNTIPTNQTKNKYVILYKTTAGLAAQSVLNATGVTGSTAPVDPVQVTCATGTGSGGGSQGTPASAGNGTIIAQPLTDFAFLENNIVPLGGDPCLFVVYDALASNLQTMLVVRDTNGDLNFKSAFVEITPRTPYRIGIVVSDNLMELYVNGKFATSTAYPGKTLTGGNTDVLFSTPGKYNQNVSVRNLFTMNRVVSSGEIRQLGGPALA